MGTISPRRRKDGSTAYTVQIRIKRDGKLVHSESETFSSHKLATEWERKRESTLDAQRARGETLGKRMTVEEMVEWYESREKEPWGRTKREDLKRIRRGNLAGKRVDTLTRQDFIAYIDERRSSGAGPATAGNDIIWLRQVFKSAAAVLGAPVPIEALDAAAEYLRQAGTVKKPNKRDRRVKPHEDAAIVEYLSNRRSKIPHLDIYRFAILTARRQEEITRLLWKDLDRDKGVALLRDVKHPTKKIGNNKYFRVLSDAWEIIDRQPRPKDENGNDLESRIFPYNAKTISTYFTNAMHFLQIEDLHFHDLRHEATSRFFERGYSIQEVAQFTLHESWNTLKRYTHLKPENVPERFKELPAGKA